MIYRARAWNRRWWASHAHISRGAQRHLYRRRRRLRRFACAALALVAALVVMAVRP